jgi:hypothetical protein
LKSSEVISIDGIPSIRGDFISKREEHLSLESYRNFKPQIRPSIAVAFSVVCSLLISADHYIERTAFGRAFSATNQVFQSGVN